MTNKPDGGPAFPKCSPTMIEGLEKMAKYSQCLRGAAVEASPNDNTGKALEARGLVKLADSATGFNRYTITDLGHAFLAARVQS